MASLLLLGSCSAVLQPDSSPVASEVGYPTAEFRAGGQLFHGLGEVAIDEGSPYGEVDLSIQGYYTGSIRIDSERCNIHKTVMYENSEAVNVNIDGPGKESCIIDFTVYPKYPAGDEIVYGFKGRLLIKVLPPQTFWYGKSYKVKEGTNIKIRIPFETEGASQLSFRGCGLRMDGFADTSDGSFVLWSLDLLKSGSPQCVYEGYVYNADRNKRLSITLWKYSEEFTPLPIPFIKTRKDKIYIVGDPSVSVIGLDDTYKLKSSCELPFTEFSGHTLRLLTIKGRSVVCEWIKDKKAWRCLQ
jgi:hypothetical protein